MIVQGIDEQVSTSLIVNKKLSIPQSVRDIVPKNWTYSLDFVTKEEALNVLMSVFPYEHDVFSSSIQYTIQFPNENVGEFMSVAAQFYDSALTGIRDLRAV